MFYYILNKLKRVWYTYADISTGSYPLNAIDTIALDGSIDTTSAIYLVTNGVTEGHLDLLDGLVADLLNKKWNSYIKYKFYFEVVVYFVFLIVQITSLIMKRAYFDYLSSSLSCTDNEEKYIKLWPSCKCAYLYPTDSARFARFFFEMVIYVYCGIQLLIVTSELIIQRLALYIQTLLFNPSKAVFIASLLCYLLIIPMRLTCQTYGEDVLTVIALICNTAYILYLGRGFRAITTFVYIIHLVLKTNFAKFFIILSVFLMGFSQAFYVAFDFGSTSLNHNFTSPLISLFNCLFMSVRVLYTVYPDFKLAKYATIGKVNYRFVSTASV